MKGLVGQVHRDFHRRRVGTPPLPIRRKDIRKLPPYKEIGLAGEGSGSGFIRFRIGGGWVPPPLQGPNLLLLYEYYYYYYY